MSDMNFICPTCKRPTHPTDNEIIEHLAKEKDRYLDALGERTKELYRTRKALGVALCSLQDIAESNGDFITGASTTLDAHEYAEMMLYKVKTALEQKEG